MAVPTLLHAPPQQSELFAHTSPFWVQNEGGLHTPFTQKLEQHVSVGPHALPSVKHAGLSGVHVPLLQAPPQHEPLDVQGWLSEMHGFTWQTPAVHVPEQQSDASMHAAPSMRQEPASPEPPPVPELLLPVLVLPVLVLPLLVLPVLVLPLLVLPVLVLLAELPPCPLVVAELAPP
jgi:hypothetical protein